MNSRPASFSINHPRRPGNRINISRITKGLWGERFKDGLCGRHGTERLRRNQILCGDTRKIRDPSPQSEAMKGLFRHLLMRRLLWVVFAIPFYYSGLHVTVWLLEPENFAGGTSWIWVTLFPVLLPACFLVNRHLGCTGGHCASGDREISEELADTPDRMPGI